MRIAVGGIEHETNTYATDITGPTTLDDFRVLRADDVLRAAGRRTMLGGILDRCAEAGHDVAPTLWAMAGPSGTIRAGAYEALKADLVERLAEAMPFDALALSMHGAGVVEGIDDLEADLVAAIRQVVGDCPIAVPLDLHGNITPEMAGLIDVMFGVHEYPHTDSYERGVETVDALARIVEGEWQPTTAVVPVPMMLPTATTDPGFPAADMRDRCLAVEQTPGVIDATFFHGFPFTDVPAAGCSIVVTTHDDRAAANRLARQLAEDLWSRRADFLSESVLPTTAIDVARRIVDERGGPVVINDTADNPGGGSPGDGTHLLRALLEADVADACFGFIFDPEVADAAHTAGTGATIAVRLGARHGDLHGEPVSADAYVKVLSDGRHTYTNPMLAGVPADLGPSVRLQLGGPGGLDVIVTSARSQTFDPGVFLLHGIDVSERSIVAVKGSQHFRAGFRDLATEIVTADSPGLTTLDVTVFEHTRAPGPVWPHVPELRWAPDRDGYPM